MIRLEALLLAVADLLGTSMDTYRFFVLPERGRHLGPLYDDKSNQQQCGNVTHVRHDDSSTGSFYLVKSFQLLESFLCVRTMVVGNPRWSKLTNYFRSLGGQNPPMTIDTNYTYRNVL